ncbi:MAG: DNA translocase FtsK [Selenomonadales bacterium]|nr:DNA translocase FtsK [Selenomonadales bacterium]
MAKTLPKKQTKKQRFSWNFNMEPKMKNELFGFLFFGLGIFALLSFFGFDCGSLGTLCNKMQFHDFGVGAIAVPTVLLLLGLRCLVNKKPIVCSMKSFGFFLLYISALAFYHHFNSPVGEEIIAEHLPAGGGLLGGAVLMMLRSFLGIDGTCAALVVLIIVAVVLITKCSVGNGLMKAQKQVETGVKVTKEKVSSTYTQIQERRQAEAELSGKRQFFNQEKKNQTPPEPKERRSILDLSELEDIDLTFATRVPTVGAMPTEPPAPLVPPAPIEKEPPVQEEPQAPKQVEASAQTEKEHSYQLPPISLLKQSSNGRPSQLAKEINRNAQILEETLENFNVRAKVTDVSCGPSVTRYELEPAPGVKVSRIVNLSDDLALKLATSGIRIEAPIPGKAAIGIEVPNKEFIGVPFREIAESQTFQNAASKLTVGLGKDIAGQPVIADLGKMPHLLVAGATGSGKSVCINTLITSILFRARPDEVKFILIDPKMVEFAAYDGISHLMAPVVTDAKKAAGALNWAVREMERRYAMFAAESVRDISRFNEVSTEPPLPAIVIIIDELADLMMVAPVDVEDAICRLAQKARAAGIHLILATQRPSVNVITGTIKANIPSRISFAVASQVDSRTILDMGGAEKLLGKGDMLYYPVGASKPKRVQGAFISDGEIASVIQHIKEQDRVQKEDHVVFPDMVEKNTSSDRASMEDELLEKAIFTVLETGQASASMLQRKFRIGYTRAGRLIDIMEEMKIVGPNAGSKAREILMTSQQVQNTYFNTENKEGADT